MDSFDIFKKLSVGAKFKKPEKCVSNLENDKCSAKQIKIKAVGDNVPNALATFDMMKNMYSLSPLLMDNLMKSGYTVPTPIQTQSIPIMLQKRQIFACAPTGSGKTAAFLVPIIHHLSKPMNKGFRALIVSPTRELAKQTLRECTRLCEGIGLRPHTFTKINKDKEKFNPKLAQKFDILIATPNRLVFLLEQEPPAVELTNIEWLVIDESDKLFETGIRGFRDQLAIIYKACGPNTKRAMFSATYTVEVAKWSKKNLDGLIAVTVGNRNTAVTTIEQDLVFVGNEEGKLIAMRDLVKKGLSPPVLIFLQSKERAKELFSELIYDGINVDVIHADRTQQQRDNTVKAFREGKIWVLICTELMGRGIDFKGVNLVVNYDFPSSAISYIHRIGRTGRAGRPGKAVTFFTNDDKPMLRSIATVMKDSGCPVPNYMLEMKKLHKNTRRKMEKQSIARDEIRAKPHRYKRPNITDKTHSTTTQSKSVSNEDQEKSAKLKVKKNLVSIQPKKDLVSNNLIQSVQQEKKRKLNGEKDSKIKKKIKKK
ncbi:Helicase, C-terminal,Helicase superfamily 1/2, ATP-binding domain,P-loop containing nucleoside [Cinara cedri]|uniref:Probable ATP-dependent RNA helicase DDX52 n=1 Tax=Cinara cedri TaxID=506608 RepID=A0A5E4MFX0_9HEMI|nr:Helicase, C-terminal,Helicase superfamily 1/2, ATP-binding domain,P-loop containing nucleoside [Cinara cedri]